MRVAMRLLGADILKRDLLRLAAEVTGSSQTEALTHGGQVILDEAKGNAPVLTGEFRESLAMEVVEDRVIVGSRLEGGKPWAIEYGTSDTPAQPTMRPAVDVGGDRAVEAIGEAIGETVDGVW